MVLFRPWGFLIVHTRADDPRNVLIHRASLSSRGKTAGTAYTVGTAIEKKVQDEAKEAKEAAAKAAKSKDAKGGAKKKMLVEVEAELEADAEGPEDDKLPKVEIPVFDEKSSKVRFVV